MKNKLAILVDLLPWLTSNPGVSAAEVAKHFNISTAEVMELLQLAVFTGPGQYGGELVDIDFEDEESLFVSDAKGLERPIKFTQEQAYQIIAGLNYLIQLPGLIDPKELEQLLSKLMRLFDINQPPIEHASSKTESDTLSALGKAIAESVAVQITYSSGNLGTLSQRKVDPKTIVIEQGYKYVKAWCHAALAIRLFRIDRILEIEITNEKQVEPQSLTEPKGNPDQEVKLLVTKHALLDLNSNHIVDIQQKGDDEFAITLLVHDLNWIAREILASQGTIKPLEPIELVELIKQKIHMWKKLNNLD